MQEPQSSIKETVRNIVQSEHQSSRQKIQLNVNIAALYDIVKMCFFEEISRDLTNQKNIWV